MCIASKTVRSIQDKRKSKALVYCIACVHGNGWADEWTYDSWKDGGGSKFAMKEAMENRSIFPFFVEKKNKSLLLYIYITKKQFSKHCQKTDIYRYLYLLYNTL